MKKTLENTFQKIRKGEQIKPKPPKIRSIARIGLLVGLGLGLIVSLNIGIYIHETQIDDVREQELERLAQQRAQIAADSAGDYLESVWQKIHFFTQQPTFAAGIAGENIATQNKFRDAIKKQLDNSVGIKFFPFGAAKLDKKSFPPVRFSELEMIRHAEQRKEVFPEAAKIDGKWVLTFVEPVPYDSNQKPAGVVMISLSLDELEERVVQQKASLGNIKLQQQFGTKKAVTVLSVGNGSVGQEYSAPIQKSYWRIAFLSSYNLLEQARIETQSVYLMIVVLSLGFVVLSTVVGRFIGVRLESNIKSRELSASSAKGVSSSEDGELLGAGQNADILDVDIDEEDEDLLGLGIAGSGIEDVSVARESEPPVAEEGLGDSEVPDVVFRAYDIRGIAKDQITTRLAKYVGQALASEALDCGQDTLVVARDARLHSPELTEWLVRGILSTGCNVLNIGTVPTPLMYFATETLQESRSGVMVTASHNPAEYNGFKVVMDGKSRSEEDIKAIRSRILKQNFHEGVGQEHKHDIVPQYIDTIFSDVALAGDVSIVIDAGNGVTANVAPRLFEELGCHVTPLFCDLDGSFPNHSPDPSKEENLQALIAKVKEEGADLGVAFDGDGDRLAVVTSTGRIVWPDQLLMLFAKDIVSRNPGADVVFDVKSTRHLNNCITSYGGRPIMWKTGHAPMKRKMQETGALVGGEYSGHIFIKDRWYGFDDGMYAAARLIEILSLQGETLDEMFEEFPVSPVTPELFVAIDESSKFSVIERLVNEGNFGDGKITHIDGVRIDFPYGWGLVRASNTSANLTLRFEADDEKSLTRLKSLFAQELLNIDSTLTIDWNN